MTDTRMQTTDDDRFRTARRAMIDSQLRTSGVNELFVLERMMAVPREEFVPDNARGTAYIDRSIALANGRKMAAPVFYGMALSEARPQSGDTVLIVDAGSGYLPELVRPLVASLDVVSPEEAAGKGGKRKTYSLVIVDGAIEQVPSSLAKRLDDKGRIVTGLVGNGVTRLAIGRKATSDIALLPLAEIGIPRLPEFDKAAGWTF